MHLGNFFAVPQPVRYFYGLLFTHTVGQQIGARIKENGTPYFIIPVIIVGKASQRRFKSADNYRHVAVSLPYPVAVDYHGSVRPHARSAARSICVRIAALFCNGIVRDHGVDIAGADHEAELRSAESFEILGAVPVGLREEADLISRRLQHARYYRGSEARMVNVRIATDIDEIHLAPAAAVHLLCVYRKESAHTVSSGDDESAHLSIHCCLVISTVLGLLPSNGPIIPFSSSSSISLAARA